MSVISIVTSRFKPDTVDEALTALHDVLEQTRAFPGCLGVEVAQNVSDPAHVFVVERWRTLEDDTAYREWRKGEGATPEAKRMAQYRESAEVVIGQGLPDV